MKKYFYLSPGDLKEYGGGGWRVWVEEMMKYGGAVMLDIYYACEFIENPWRKVLEQNKFRQKMERLNNKLKLNKEIAEHK